MASIVIPGDVGEVSDGQYSFNELYDHRCLLFCAILKLYGGWKSNLHCDYDGSSLPGWFAAGTIVPSHGREVGKNVMYRLPENMWTVGKNVMYRLPENMWTLCQATIVSRSPRLDASVPEDVASAFREWLAAAK